jgi:hypothetical protein
MSTHGMIALIFILLTGLSNAWAQEGHLDVAIETDAVEYYVGERIVFVLTIYNSTNYPVTVETGQLDFGLYGAMKLYDECGKQLMPYFSMEGTQVVEIMPSERKEYYVPLNIYGKRRPYSMTAAPVPGRYTWNHNFRYFSKSKAGYEQISRSGSFVVTQWPARDNEYIERLIDINTPPAPSEEKYVLIEEMSRQAESRRVIIIMLDMLRYYAKRLNRKNDYQIVMQRISSYEDCQVCEYLIRTERKALQVGKILQNNSNRR